MTESADAERAYYFQDLSHRTIEQAARACTAAAGADGAGEAAGNLCGMDLERCDLDLIALVAAGSCEGLSPWREAQARELAFWRWVAVHGYGGNHPLLFPLFQEHLMVSTFYRTGWAMGEFRGAAVVEIGCGPLGMIEYVAARRRVAFDPLNDRYGRLFANFRSADVEYLVDRDRFRQDPTLFELGICHNVIDHTDDPAGWFNTLFAKIAPGGRFIFQVNLSKAETPQVPAHRRMHPSPITFEQVSAWLGAKSDAFDHFCETQANRDGEYYFLAWGRKTSDEPVSYRKLID
ncbi:MAG TPA: class I SAM-dependent methyltransferase [Stellaceae bacterium]|nr:class I SAM-dependent methyltransferase [Stellaceae bacterium]